MNHQTLIIVAALAVIGLFALVSGGRHRARRAANHARLAAHSVSLFGRVLVAAGAIVAGQYAVIRYGHNDLLLLLAALALPALLAAVPLVRALTMTTVTADRKRVRR